MRDHSQWYIMIKKATFKELLDRNKAVSMHTRNLHFAEMFKVKIGELLSLMHEIFQKDDSNKFNLRRNRGFKAGNSKTVYYGPETISVSGPKLRIILPDEYQN